MKRPFSVLVSVGITITVFAVVFCGYLISQQHNTTFDVGYSPQSTLLYITNDSISTAISLTQTAKAATETPIPTPNNLDPRFLGQDINLSPISTAAGEGKLNLNITLPDGYALNDQSPFTLHVYNNDLVSVNPKDNDLKIIVPKMPVVIPVTLKAGQSTLIMDTRVYYCEAVDTTRCYPARLRLIAPLNVSASGSPNIAIDYMMVVPKEE